MLRKGYALVNFVVAAISGFVGGAAVYYLQFSSEPAVDLDNQVLAAPGIHMQGFTMDGQVITQPIIQWYRDGNRIWEIGLDVANSAIDDLVLAARDNGQGGVTDVIYLRDYEEHVAVGLQYTPPPPGARVSMSGATDSDWDTLLVRVGQNQTGEAIRVINSAGDTIFTISPAGRITYDERNVVKVEQIEDREPSEPGGYLLIEVEGDVVRVPFYVGE